ncbi:unnamed protein product [Amoebophrya sp. A25]|nr:unnamed protein product [Amoebophrya sp. A25]|eukprot:GSA25T00002526001.1
MVATTNGTAPSAVATGPAVAAKYDLPPGFSLVYEFVYESVPVVMARHDASKLAICLAQVKSPCVNGYFAVHTEAFDDYGVPHTLEHLVFMGSKNYPYKGILDLLANQCLAQGTNAWTDTDNTTYTIETAGSEGFLQIMPIYLDHMFFPTLTQEAFHTEVHHIDGEGVDSGVVYCEMQARENEMDDIMEYVRKGILFTDKNKSLKAETGGRLKELRELTNKQIQDYHAEYYTPENVCVIVCGQVGLRELCEKTVPILAEWETVRGPFEKTRLEKRPFSTTALELPTKGHYKEHQFPAEDDEAGGCVQVSWFGPHWGKFDEILACETLLDYFCKDSSSPLRKFFCEGKPMSSMSSTGTTSGESATTGTTSSREPFCGHISSGKLEVAHIVFTVELESVNLETVDDYTTVGGASKKIDEVILDVIKHETTSCEKFDYDRLRSILELGKRKHLQRLESSPHDTYADFLSSEFLFGPTFARGSRGSSEQTTSQPGAVLLEHMSKVERYDRLLDATAWPVSRWLGLLRSVFVDNHRVCLFGKPSKETAEKLQNDEEQRLEAQKKQIIDTPLTAGSALGGGLARYQADLDAADAKNGIDPPSEVLANSIEAPDLRKVQLIPCETKNVDNVPHVRAQFDSIDGAQFCDLRFVYQLPTAVLESRPDLLAVLPVWRALAFQSPLKASKLGPALTADETVKKVTELFNASHLQISAGRGAHSPFGVGPVATDALFFYAKVAKSATETGGQFLLRIKEDVLFTEEKVKVAVSKLLNELPQEKRSAWPLCCLASRPLLAADSSMSKVLSWPQILKEFAGLSAGAAGGKGAGGSPDEDGEGDDEGMEDGEGDDGGEDEEMAAASQTGEAEDAMSVVSAAAAAEAEASKAAAVQLTDEQKAAKFQEILAKLQELQSHLTSVAVHVGGEVKSESTRSFFLNDLWNLSSVKYQALKSWKGLKMGCDETKKIFDQLAVPATATSTSSPTGIIVYASSIESNYLRMQTPCFSDLNHPDVVPLLLACECFVMLEGPFWRKIRGKGLAYNYDLGLSLDNGMLTFVLQKSSNPVSALEEAKNIVRIAIQGKMNSDGAEAGDSVTNLLRDPIVLRAARSGITYDLIAGISTVPNIIGSSFVDTISRRGANRVSRVLARLMEVTPEDVQRVAKQYIAPLFSIEDVDGAAAKSSSSTVLFSASTPTNKLAKTQQDFSALGFKAVALSVTEIEETFSKPEGYAEVREKLKALHLQ